MEHNFKPGTKVAIYNEGKFTGSSGIVKKIHRGNGNVILADGGGQYQIVCTDMASACRLWDRHSIRPWTDSHTFSIRKRNLRKEVQELWDAHKNKFSTLELVIIKNKLQKLSENYQ